MRMQVSGVKEIRAELKRLAREYPDALAAAMYKLGVAVLQVSLPLVPVEFGVLRASAYVSPPTGKREDTNVEVGYGTVYAVPQHERLDYRHPRGGQAKYLEAAVDSLAPRSLSLLAKWATEIAEQGGKWSAMPGVSTRPRVTNSTRKTASQTARLRRAGANVRKRTGR